MSEASPTAAVSAWLESFGAALQAGDVAAAADLFEPDGFWRDLVSFTWNISTLEGRDEIAAMLDATLDGVRPVGWHDRGRGDRGRTASPTAWFTLRDRRRARPRPRAAARRASAGRC